MTAFDADCLRMLRVFGPCSNAEVARRLGEPSHKTYRSLYRLVEKGYAIHPKLQQWDISLGGVEWFNKSDNRGIRLFTCSAGNWGSRSKEASMTTDDDNRWITPDMLLCCGATEAECAMATRWMRIKQYEDEYGDDQYQVWVVVGDQSFRVGCPHGSLDTATWYCWKFAKALLVVGKEKETP